MTSDSELFFTRPVPHDMEIALLGTLLFTPDAILEVNEVLEDGSAFGDPFRGRVYDAMLAVHAETGGLDIVGLSHALGSNEKDKAKLIEYAESTPSGGGYKHYANIVADCDLRRRLMDLCQSSIVNAHKPEARGVDALASTLRDLSTLGENSAGDGDFDLGTEFRKIGDRLVRGKEDDERRWLTGFRQLDEITGGMRAGNLIILAARPGMGKTATALNLAINAASSGNKVSFFSLEMNRQEISKRMACVLTGIPFDIIDGRSTWHGEDDYRAFEIAEEQAATLAIHGNDSPSLTMEQLRLKALRHKAKYQTDLLIVDYLGLVRTPGDQLYAEITFVSKAMKALAREMDCPLICLAQLNRGVEARDDKRPRMSDLRDSGAIEQDANQVWMLYNDDYYHKNDPHHDPKNILEVIVAKNRNGETGTAHLKWWGPGMGVTSGDGGLAI
jgi:replicative DNA helicase